MPEQSFSDFLAAQGTTPAAAPPPVAKPAASAPAEQSFGDFLSQSKPSSQVPTPDQAVVGATTLGRVMATLHALPAEAWNVANTHAIKALGGATAAELYENAGHASKELIESLGVDPQHAPPGVIPAAKFLYHAGKLIPNVLDFLYTPLGAAGAALPGAPAAVRAGAEAAFSTQMARDLPAKYQAFQQNPSAATGGDLFASTAATALPLIHAGGTEYRNRVRDAHANLIANRTPAGGNHVSQSPPEAQRPASAGQAPNAQPPAETSPVAGQLAGPAQPVLEPQPAAVAPNPAATHPETPEVNHGHAGNPQPEREAVAGSPGGAPPLSQGNQPGVLRGSAESGGSGPAGGQPQPAATGEGASHRRVTGSIDIPLNDRGVERAAELKRRAGSKPISVFHAPNLRSTETARTIHSGAHPADWLEPWRMGAHEGKPLDSERHAINDRIANRPDESTGTSPSSGEKGESFNAARERVIGGLQDQLAHPPPNPRVLNITSGRVLAIVDAWAAKGMPADGSVDVAKLTSAADEFAKPGDIFRLTDKGLLKIKRITGPGTHFAVHGDTELNTAGPSEKAAPAAKPTPEAPPELAAKPSTAAEKPQVANVHDETRAPAPAESPAAPAPRTPAIAPAYGRGVKVSVPGETTTYAARYALREASDVHPSHNAFSFERNPAFEFQNDRDYKNNKSISSLVVERGGPAFDPSYTTTESATAENGAPVVDPRGNVLGGNSRAMTQARVYELNPEGSAAYKAALREKAAQHGIDAAAVDRFERPVLVRELVDQPAKEQAQNAITDFNKKAAGSLAPEEQAVADGRRLSDRTVALIAAKLEDVGEDSTLAQAIEGEDGVEIVEGLVRDAIVTAQERGALVNDGKLTPAAKDRIAKMLVGRMFEEPSGLAQTPPEMRSKLERIAPHVLRLEGRPEWNITPRIREAISLIGEAREHGFGNLRDIVDQPQLTGELKDYHPDTVAIGEALQAKPTAAARAFRQFANDEQLSRGGAQSAFFEPPTRAEAFESAFGKEAAFRHKGKIGKFAAEETGSAPPDILGVGKFVEQDISPALRSAAVNLAAGADDILKVLAPTLRGGEGVERGKLAMRARLGEFARRGDQARAALRQAEHFFNRQTAAHNYEFWDRIEVGQKQANSALDAIAGILRPLLDGRRRDVQALGTGKLQKWYENYFPRAWKDTKSATGVIRAFFARRPFEGGKTFLKHRTYPTMAEGRAAGLVPITDNPVTMALWKVQEMDRYIAAHRTLNDWKRERQARFVDARSMEARQAMSRAGWREIPDPIGTVYGPSVQDITEYPNQGTWNGLQAVAHELGLTQKRGFLNLHGAIGRAQKGTGIVSTLHGTAEDVLAHEIGHQIDWLAGSGQRFVLDYPDAQTVKTLREAYATLKDDKGATTLEQRRAARETIKSLKGKIAQRKEFKAQLKRLADLRGGAKSYTHSREEKMAQLAEMWVGSRELFQRTAPTVFAEWKQFLDDNPKLHALRDIEGDTEVDAMTQPYDVGGMVIKGHWFAPEGLARLMENHLMPGLVQKSGLFRGVMGISNHLNLFNLGLSAFHVGKTTFESSVSKGALAYESLLRGHPLDFGSKLGEALIPGVAPLRRFLTGDKMLREWYSPGSQGAEIGELADHAMQAGARARMDSIYRTNMRQSWRHAIAEGNLPGALVRSPSAAMETLTSLIMDQIVPRLKMGVFADMARQHLAELGPDANSFQVRRTMANDWTSVENRLGEVTRDNLFWNRYARDLSAALMRADQWFLGTVREVGGGLADLVVQPVRAAQGKPVNLNRVTYIASMLTIHMAYSGLYQYLKTGKPPAEFEDWFYPKNGETDELGRPQRSSLPSYVKDVHGMFTHPGQTMHNKLAPVIPLVTELLRNSDYHTEIRNPDDPPAEQTAAVGKFLLQQFLPFSIRNLEREMRLGGSTATEAEQFVGMTPAPAELNQGPAERFVHELEHVKGGEETISQEAAARRELRNELTRALRQAKPAPAAVVAARQAGKLSSGDIHLAVHAAHETPLEAAFAHLPIADALRAYLVADPRERRQLRPALVRKAQAAIKAAPPAERAAEVARLRAALALR